MQTYPINWYEGMFLRSHHFQKNHQYFQSQIQSFNMFFPHFYGVIDIIIDKIAISNGFISILGGGVLFSDGQFFLNLENYEIPKLNINNKTNGNILIYIAILSKGSHDKQNSTFVQDVDDLNSENNIESIHFLKRKIFLLTEDMVQSYHTAIPICFIKSFGTSFEILDFTPPCLFVKKNYGLSRKLLSLSMILKEHLYFLLWYDNKQTNQQSNDLYLLFLTLSPEIMSFESMIEEESHPFQLYLTLLRINAILCFYKKNVPVLSGYSHFNLKNSFGGLLDSVSNMLKSISLNSNMEYFVSVNKNRQELFLGDEWDNKKNLEIIVMCKNTEDTPNLMDFCETAQIFSFNFEKEIMLKRILGIKRVSSTPLKEAISEKSIIILLDLDSPWFHVPEKLIIQLENIQQYTVSIKKDIV
jgi:predicted component of type VI protein secretion system